MTAPAISAMPALPAMDAGARLLRLRAALDDAGCDALIVTSLTNVRYLTGFTGSAGMLLVMPEKTVLVTDGRYETQASEQVATAGIDASTAIAPAAKQRELVASLVASGGPRRLGLEAAHVSWARERAFASDWFPHAELVPTEGLVEQLRRVKDAGEIARLARAAEIADAALSSVRSLLADRPTEISFGQALDFEMRQLGASGPSFETIVASGPNAAKPHHRPSKRRIESGELIVLDFGAVVDGYCSDMTRTVSVGRPASGELVRMVDVVAASQAAGVAAVGPGVACSEVDRVCREVIASAGWGERFVHGTGHGVGLDIHEAPSVAATSSDTLLPGHVVTVEPGVYLPGFAGVRIEDTVVVTDEGCYPLTTTPKELC
ncbi:MAG TPA: aminopeptidase P family protein [Acidimicrobiales bacterium]|nr:aminopeptidase P family protein [Acidimicrobiales bacterium]